jgi:hypothetical protein
MKLSNVQVVLKIEFPNQPPIYLVVKRVDWIYQYYIEINKYKRQNENFHLSVNDSRLFFMPLGIMYDLYSVDDCLTLTASWTRETEPEFKDLFLQSLKESEYLCQGSTARIQSLSVDQLNDIVNSLEIRELKEICYFPIKIYFKDKMILKKFSREYWDKSLVLVIQEYFPGQDVMYFGVLLSKEFKFSDSLKVLTRDQWCHLVLKSSEVTLSEAKSSEARV